MQALMVGSFFFASRRRHTSLVSDWSSDVCSSDLTRKYGFADRDTKLARSAKPYFLVQLCGYAELLRAAQDVLPDRRSEERRVGKEGRPGRERCERGGER